MQARLCLIALYNCHTPQKTRVLSSLPKMYQDTAEIIIDGHLRRSSTPGGNNSPSSSSPLSSSSSPKPLQSPSIGGGGSGPFSLQHQHYKTSPRSRQSSVDHELLLNYGSNTTAGVDIHQNIHKTTEEIRNCFGLEAGTSSTANTRQYRSLPTGTSNGFNVPMDPTIDQQDSYASSNSKTQSATTTESNTPESTTTMRMDDAVNITPVTPVLQHHKYTYILENGEIVLEDGRRESEIIKEACQLNVNTPIEDVQRTLRNLSICIKGGNCEQPNKHFRAIMKMLMTLFKASASEIVIVALRVLAKILRSEKMQSNWIKFLELITLDIFGCYTQCKAVQREIDLMIPRIVPVLPLEATLKTVNPVIATDQFPINLCALKLLTELIERHGSELTNEQLESIFPNLVRLTDNQQSTVRKAAVFCIVKIYIVIGEGKVKPRLTQLSPSKIRLLNIYIERERTATSGGGGGGSSTKNSSASSS